MVKYYNGEMYRIPQAFEDEVRADERTKVLDEVEAKLLANGFIITHHALDVWHEIAEQLKGAK